MPPSVPPARSLARTMRPSARWSSSWAAEPRRVVVRKPSPTSTPLMAWMPMSAAASCESRRRSQCTCEPRPGRHAVGEHLDDAAERVAVLVGRVDLGHHARRRLGVEAAQRIGVEAVDVVGQRQRASPRARARGRSRRCATRCGCRARRGTRARPRRARRARPSRGRSRARAPGGPRRSRTSACRRGRRGPGRGRVSGAPRPRPSLAGSTGSGLMTSCHFGHSVLPMRSAMGLPRLSPWRTPPEIASSSCSNFMRAPRP